MGNNSKCIMTEDKCNKTCPYCEQLSEKDDKQN